jgi:hypothetical protein
MVTTTVWESQAIERIDVRDFDLARLKRRTPAIVSGALTEWKALGTWTPEYLASVLGDREVRVAVSKDHKYNYAAAKTAFEPLTRFDKTLMPFSQFVTKLLNSKAAGEHYYLMQRPIEESSPNCCRTSRGRRGWRIGNSTSTSGSGSKATSRRCTTTATKISRRSARAASTSGCSIRRRPSSSIRIRRIR